jgi:hypothetical protein
MFPARRNKEDQRRSFAYRNTKIENPRITREMVDRQADVLRRSEELASNRIGQNLTSNA